MKKESKIVLMVLLINIILIAPILIFITLMLTCKDCCDAKIEGRCQQVCSFKGECGQSDIAGGSECICKESECAYYSYHGPSWNCTKKLIDKSHSGFDKYCSCRDDGMLILSYIFGSIFMLPILCSAVYLISIWRSHNKF